MLITEHYRQQNAELIKTCKDYAVSGHRRRQWVREASDWGRKEILDYGAGRELLKFSLGPGYTVHSYDPCVEEISALPQPAPIVHCGDVLEHIEPECLDDVLAHLRALTLERGIFSIAMVPSLRTLPDGRNTHLIVENEDWWRDKLRGAGFTIVREKDPEDVQHVFGVEVV